MDDENKLMISDVDDWVLEYGSHEGRLNFFAMLENNKLFDKVLEPLLSLRTTGSVTVERIAKTMKHKVLADFRANLGDKRAEICLRAGLNLAYLMNLRKEIRQVVANN